VHSSSSSSSSSPPLSPDEEEIKGEIKSRGRSEAEDAEGREGGERKREIKKGR